jgi:hypothetical protein
MMPRRAPAAHQEFEKALDAGLGEPGVPKDCRGVEVGEFVVAIDGLSIV